MLGVGNGDNGKVLLDLAFCLFDKVEGTKDSRWCVCSGELCLTSGDQGLELLFAISALCQVCSADIKPNALFSLWTFDFNVNAKSQ
jgi:hypothetical protein